MTQQVSSVLVCFAVTIRAKGHNALRYIHQVDTKQMKVRKREYEITSGATSDTGFSFHEKRWNLKHFLKLYGHIMKE